MIRIESRMDLALNVPFPTQRGMAQRFFTIPAAQAGKPGVVELPELDSITMARLRHHYDRRPADPKQPDGQQIEIGLLKISVVDSSTTRKKAG
jgi:hypothetical protein